MTIALEADTQQGAAAVTQVEPQDLTAEADEVVTGTLSVSVAVIGPMRSRSAATSNSAFEGQRR
jgi:hypothetical protein